MFDQNAVSTCVLVISLAAAPLAADTKLELLVPNWSDADHHAFWFTHQGSKIMPMTWFLVLQRSDYAEPFSSADSLERYVFIKDALE